MRTERNRPRVSIGLPVFNGERYLEEAILALRAQTFEDFELIICDNASTDGTKAIGEAHAAADSRVRYVRNPRNLGAANNYCRTFELARGAYFRWATADDLSAPETVERCVDVLDGDPAVVLAYPKTRLIDEHGSVTSEYEDGLHLQSSRPSERYKRLVARLGLCNAVYGLMRSEMLQKTGLLGSYLGSDIILLAELTLYGTFWEVPEMLFYRRMHAAAFSSQKVHQQMEFYKPNVKHGVTARTWRHLWESFRAVERAPLSMAERMRLRGYLLLRGVRSRTELGQELLCVARKVFWDA